MQLEFNVQIWKEDEQYIAHAMPLDVASAGRTAEAARAALDEAVLLFLRTAAGEGTLEQVLEDAGYVAAGDEWQSPVWVAVERHVVAA
jgi:predicted RNase H-like HicB family nuclease